MMFLCEYALRPGMIPEALMQRAHELHQLGTSRQDLIETWYSYPSEHAGFMVLHADDMSQLADVLRPYEDILTYEARPVLEAVNYEERVGVGNSSSSYAAAS